MRLFGSLAKYFRTSKVRSPRLSRLCFSGDVLFLALLTKRPFGNIFFGGVLKQIQVLKAESVKSAHRTGARRSKMSSLPKQSSDLDKLEGSVLIVL